MSRPSAAAVALLLAACATPPPPAEPPAPTLDEVAFAAAMADAAGQSPADAWDGLFPLADGNPALVWRDPAARHEVLVVSLMSQGAYDRYWAGQDTGRTWDGAPVSWVTLAPQLQAFCRATGLEGDALERRIRQYLGLRPDRSYDLFVEMWVDRDDLFRPCPDPETDDTACEPAFAIAGGMPVAPQVKGVPDYLAWFESTYLGAYGEGGAPWTRLGYTYDWNPATPKFGASEYLVTTDAPYEIETVATIGDYCAP